jgi:hypothetical protein
MKLLCYIKYQNGHVESCFMTKKEAWKAMKDKNISQIKLFKRGRVCANYVTVIS